jgi:hypothetical protein
MRKSQCIRRAACCWTTKRRPRRAPDLGRAPRGSGVRRKSRRRAYSASFRFAGIGLRIEQVSCRIPAPHLHFRTPMTNSRTWELLRETGSAWLEDDVPRLAAALAYYTLLSLTPLVVIAVALAGLVFGEQAARGHIADGLVRIVGPESALALETVVMNARRPDTGLINGLLGLAVLLFGASAVFGELQAAMNRIWGSRPGRGAGCGGRSRIACSPSHSCWAWRSCCWSR